MKEAKIIKYIIIEDTTLSERYRYREWLERVKQTHGSHKAYLQYITGYPDRYLRHIKD